MNTRHTVAVACLLVFSSVPGTVHADDGGIAFGGSPRLLAGHPSVSMQSEVVHLTVGKDAVHVDCQFVFQNSGPACTVRMGFPDQGRGSDDPDEEGPQKHPTGTFSSYTSYVDGVQVATQTIRADKPGNFWHVKTVSFPAHATRLIRDVYTVSVGGGIIEHGSISQTYYVLHTGSSWHGPIGRAEIDVTFAPGSLPTPLRAVPLSAAPGNDDAKYPWASQPHGTVLYRGPATPTVAGRTLRFIRTNFKPGYLDDVLLSFGFVPIPNS